MKLTDVARASLSELRGDFEVFILDRNQVPWSIHSPEAKGVNAISLDPASFSDDVVHESAKHVIEQRRKYSPWLDADDAVVVANAMLIIIGRALNMLKGQIEAQGKALKRPVVLAKGLRPGASSCVINSSRLIRPIVPNAENPCAVADRRKAIFGGVRHSRIAREPGRQKNTEIINLNNSTHLARNQLTEVNEVNDVNNVIKTPKERSELSEGAVPNRRQGSVSMPTRDCG
jgi:hypothetical protein